MKTASSPLLSSRLNKTFYQVLKEYDALYKKAYGWPLLSHKEWANISKNYTMREILIGMFLGVNVYNYVGNDSMYREICFRELSHALGCEYDVIYKIWKNTTTEVSIRDRIDGIYRCFSPFPMEQEMLDDLVAKVS